MKRIIDIVRHPRAAVVGHDLLMVVFAWVAAGWVTDGPSAIPIVIDTEALTGLSVVLLLQGGVLWATGLYKGLWRFASFQDLWNIARATVFGTVAIMAVLASIRSPATLSHFDHPMPHRRVKRLNPPDPAMTPISISGTPNWALSAAKRKSAEHDISTPNPKHGACMAITIGFSMASISSRRLCNWR